MSEKTEIAWTDSTWNPISGCTRVSSACDHCYIERTPPLRMAHRRFDKPGVGGTTGVMLHPERLGQPLKWRKPRRIFVCSLADLFHDDVPDDYIANVFGIMAYAGRHTFQVLTKRHARLRSLLSSDAFHDAVADRVLRDDKAARSRWSSTHWPLRNVWVGVTVENQEWADLRIPALLRTPAAARFISAEPLLGPVDLFMYANRLDWVIAGGESGPGARPTDPEWFRDVRDQCAKDGVAFHFKQWGEWAPTGAMTYRRAPFPSTDRPRRCLVGEPDNRGYRSEMAKVGKKTAGRELDGRTWDEFPAVVT